MSKHGERFRRTKKCPPATRMVHMQPTQQCANAGGLLQPTFLVSTSCNAVVRLQFSLTQTTCLCVVASCNFNVSEPVFTSLAAPRTAQYAVLTLAPVQVA